MVQNGYKAEITGTTRTESIYRRSLSPIKLPSKNPKIIRVNPIYDWNEWEVWRYIRENNIRYNPLYDMGYRRIGCWCCPLNGPSHYKRLKKTHPKLYNFLCNFEPLHPVMAIHLGASQSNRVEHASTVGKWVVSMMIKRYELWDALSGTFSKTYIPTRIVESRFKSLVAHSGFHNAVVRVERSSSIHVIYVSFCFEDTDYDIRNRHLNCEFLVVNNFSKSFNGWKIVY